MLEEACALVAGGVKEINLIAQDITTYGRDLADGATLEGLIKELTAAKVDFQVVLYSGAVHAFTQPGAGNDPSQGMAYNAEADRRSWQAMRDFFDEMFK